MQSVQRPVRHAGVRAPGVLLPFPRLLPTEMGHVPPSPHGPSRLPVPQLQDVRLPRSPIGISCGPSTQTNPGILALGQESHGLACGT